MRHKRVDCDYEPCLNFCSLLYYTPKLVQCANLHRALELSFTASHMFSSIIYVLNSFSFCLSPRTCMRWLCTISNITVFWLIFSLGNDAKTILFIEFVMIWCESSLTFLCLSQSSKFCWLIHTNDFTHRLTSQNYICTTITTSREKLSTLHQIHHMTCTNKRVIGFWFLNNSNTNTHTHTQQTMIHRLNFSHGIWKCFVTGTTNGRDSNRIKNGIEFIALALTCYWHWFNQHHAQIGLFHLLRFFCLFHVLKPLSKSHL